MASSIGLDICSPSIYEMATVPDTTFYSESTYRYLPVHHRISSFQRPSNRKAYHRRERIENLHQPSSPKSSSDVKEREGRNGYSQNLGNRHLLQPRYMAQFRQPGDDQRRRTRGHDHHTEPEEWIRAKDRGVFGEGVDECDTCPILPLQ